MIQQSLLIILNAGLRFGRIKKYSCIFDLISFSDTWKWSLNMSDDIQFYILLKYI